MIFRFAFALVPRRAEGLNVHIDDQKPTEAYLFIVLCPVSGVRCPTAKSPWPRSLPRHRVRGLWINMKTQVVMGGFQGLLLIQPPKLESWHRDRDRARD